MLKPQSFGQSVEIQLSTSQWIGLITALLVSYFYASYWQSARQAPVLAMSLGEGALEPTPDDSDEDEEVVAEKDPPKKKRKKRAKPAGEAADDVVESPAKATKPEKADDVEADAPAGDDKPLPEPT